MFQNWHINLPKDFAWVLEKKRSEKDRFLDPKCWTGRGSGQPTQPVGEPIDQLPLSGRGPIEECQKHSLSSSSLLFSIEIPSFPANLRSRSDRGNNNLLKH